MANTSIMRGLPLSISREAAAGEEGTAVPLDEDAFRAFYDRNARGLWAYLSRVTGDRQLADDLLQETFYRFLRAGARHSDEAHRRNSLYRIATNLARDSGRRARHRGDHEPFDDEAFGAHLPPPGKVAGCADLAGAMARLKASEREMLWLAYGQGLSHREIAGTLGLKAASIRLLLFRARRKLANLLRDSGAPKGRGR